MHSIKMAAKEVMNTLVKQNINIRKVIELSSKIKVNKKEIVQPPMTESTTYLSSYSNTFDIVYAPLYDTTFVLGTERINLFTKPVGPDKSYALTNMLVSGQLPAPCMYVVKGFDISSGIRNEKLSKLVMTFFVLNKSYAEMPLSHLPFEYPDNRIIIPSMASFHVEIRNESTELITDELVFFISGWELRSVQ